ncbi:hypothetical protein NGC23_20080 [Leclercia pneumoniae]|uniref:hypothetical protein n=1 Tax=Leclercia pneumoniae TaxID=2815358 RepID=UPI002DBAC8B0|nr:hypothetical protein [Leclercia pneumoniae]MEB7502466.1 hypothetical protein [Leclercia pneumoniae]
MKKITRYLKLSRPSDNQLEATRNLVRDLIASSALFALLHAGARFCSPASSFIDYVFLFLLLVCLIFVLVWSSFITDLNLRHITGTNNSDALMPYSVLAICFTVVFLGLTFILLENIW